MILLLISCISYIYDNQFSRLYINSLVSDLQFTLEVGGDELCFLDLKLKLRNNKITTSVYSKPTDSHLYLYANSCHKKSTIKGVQKGVALRLRRICSTENEYKTKSNEYMSHLTNRGHDPSEVKKSFAAVENLTRTDARKKVNKNFKNDNIIFSTNYNPLGPNIRNIIYQNINIIQNVPALKKLFPPHVFQLLINARKI